MNYFKITRGDRVSFLSETSIKELTLEDGIFRIVTKNDSCWGDSIESVQLDINQLIEIANNYVFENQHLIKPDKDYDDIEF